MILYFADRVMNIKGQASSALLKGFQIVSDKKYEDIESGVASFECTIAFDDENRLLLEEMTDAGNYLLRSCEGENEFYTIIDTEIDAKRKEIYIYAEDAGLDLLNEVAGEYEADNSYPITHYVEKWIFDSGFEIGINEVPATTTRKLSWTGEASVTDRLASIATQFGGYEISYSFAVKGMEVSRKYVNIHQKRGKDIGIQLRLNREIDSIITKKSVANLATAFICTGGTPEESDKPITLKGYTYDDGDFYVGSDGVLRSRKAIEKWSRYVWNKEPNLRDDSKGHIWKTYSYDTLSQQTLCSHAITELKKICDMEINFEIELKRLPDGVKIGDRVDVVDDGGQLYLSTRILKLETSEVDREQKATLGEHLIKGSGISQKVEALAEQFSEIVKSKAFYTWVAYADDENGTGISLSPEGKDYLGIASNRTTKEVDISDPSIFKWTKIKGESGTQGDTGISVTSIVTEYCLSASSTVAPGNDDNWTETVPEWSSGHYIWERKVTTWSDGSVTISDPVLSSTLNRVNEVADSTQQQLGEALDAADEAIKQAGIAADAANAAAQSAADADAAAQEAAANTAQAVEQAGIAAEKSAEAIAKAADSIKKANEAKENVDEINDDIKEVRKEFVAGLETVTKTMSDDFAKKTDLIEYESSLQAQISANAKELLLTHSKVEDIKIDTSEAVKNANAAQTMAFAAQSTADNAKTAADKAQEFADAASAAATVAQDEATETQEHANTAKTTAASSQVKAEEAEDELQAAKETLAAVKGNSESTEAEIAAAQAAVDAAFKAATRAKADAITAQSLADFAQSRADAARQNATKAQEVAAQAQADAAAAKEAADEAQAKADKITEELQKMGDRVTKAETEIQKNADAITLTATKKEVRGIVDGLEIGGRNLLLNTGVPTTIDATGNDNKWVKVPMSVTQLEEGQVYTFSANVDISAGSPSDISIALYNADINKNSGRATLPISGGRISGQITAGANAESFLVYCGLTGSTADNVITFSNMKLEKGNKKTDWSPDPDDFYSKEQTEARLTVKADEITSVVQRSCATKGEVEDTNTRITQLSDGITATVSSAVKTEVDGITIGGRNLIASANEEKPITATFELFNLTDYGMQVIKNKKVTASFEARTNFSDVTIDCYLRYINPETNSGKSVGRQAISGLTNQWQKFSLTFDTSSAENNNIEWLAIYDGTEEATVWVRNVKLEIGDKATDWTLAPEDYYTKEQTQAELKILSDSITSTVSGTYATKDALSAAESQIKQTADSITSTVQTTFAGLSIGGRNLLLTPPNNQVSIQNTRYEYKLTDYGIGVIKNKKVTASFEAYVSTPNVDIDCYLRYVTNPDTNSGMAVNTQLIKNLSVGWQRYTVTLDATLAGNDTITQFAIRSVLNSSVNIHLRNVKLELGDKATDWTPAPEDMTSKTELTQTEEDLTFKIDGASKTATDYFKADGTGFAVGDFSDESSTLGNNVLIGSDNVSIRNGTTVNSRFAGDSIELGRNSQTATADILGGAFKIKYTTEIDTGGFGVYGKVEKDDGTTYERLAFQPINQNGNLTLGYGGYAAAINTSGDMDDPEKPSGTNIWGNEIWLRSANDIYLVPRYNRSGQTNRCVDLIGHLKLHEGNEIFADYVHGTKNYNFYLGVANSPNLIRIYQTNGDNSPTTDNVWFRPEYNNRVLLGTQNYKWKEIHSQTEVDTTSDRNVKKDITSMDERYERLFSLLKPVIYKFIDGDSGRFHTGFISQDIEEALSEVGLTAFDFAAFCKDKKVNEIENPETGEITAVDICDENGDPEYNYSLRYGEFIALNTHMIQKLQAEKAELQNKVSSLEERLEKLEALIQTQ